LRGGSAVDQAAIASSCSSHELTAPATVTVPFEVSTEALGVDLRAAPEGAPDRVLHVAESGPGPVS
jgi:hypothetical protein